MKYRSLPRTNQGNIRVIKGETQVTAGLDERGGDCYPYVMTCSECWTTVPAGTKKCPRCGAKITGARPSFLGLAKNYPWLIVVLALSLVVTLWAATRRAPVPVAVDIPPAVEPEIPAPTPEPDPEPPVLPVAVEPAPAPVSQPAPEPIRGSAEAPPPPSAPANQNPDGTWGGSAPARPSP